MCNYRFIEINKCCSPDVQKNKIPDVQSLSLSCLFKGQNDIHESIQVEIVKEINQIEDLLRNDKFYRATFMSI